MKKQMKLFLGGLLLLLSNYVLANSVTVNANPARPVFNEEFELIFDVTTSFGSDEPYISFEPGFAEVRGRRLASRQSNARIINGKVTTSNTYRYIYQLFSKRAGVLSIRNIVVEVGDKKIRVPDKVISIGTKRSEPKQFFLRAEVDKKNAYVGEGLSLNYYLYSRVQNVGRSEIEIFPKLNNFIKRFYMPKNERQTVEVDGITYRRSLEYSARIFPEKAGTLKVDSLRLKFPYTDYRKNRRGFGSFGLSFGRSKIKSLSSDPVTINVSEVPPGSMPDNYTQLIGDHQFSITVNKNKFLVNEAIEVRFEVTGPGALENYPAPTLYQDPELEQFDTKSELTEISKQVGKKIFEYTYLARGPISFKEKIISFSIFDPNTKSFRSKEVIMPPIIVGGGEIKAHSSEGGEGATQKGEAETQTEMVARPILKKNSVLAPDFAAINDTTKGRWINYLNYLLMLFIMIIIVEFSALKLRNRNIPPSALELTKEMQRKGVSYSRLNKYIRLNPLYCEGVNNNMTLEEIVGHLPLSEGCKKYFIENIQITENIEYNEVAKKYDNKFVKKHFNEMNSKMMSK